MSKMYMGGLDYKNEKCTLFPQDNINNNFFFFLVKSKSLTYGLSKSRDGLSKSRDFIIYVKTHGLESVGSANS